MALGALQIRDLAGSKIKIKMPSLYTSFCDFTFERVIMDECQYVKSICTRAHQRIAQLPRMGLFGLTATPMWNPMLDIYGYCSLLAGHLPVDESQVAESLPRPEGVACRDLKSLYKAWSNVRVLPEDPSKTPYALINPAMLIKLREKKGEITHQIGYEAYPFIFRAAVMQRSMDDRVVDQSGKIVVIGSEIPPIRVMTIELRYFEEDQRLHDVAYWGLIGDLHKSKDDGIPDEFSPQGGRQNMRILRTLALAAFNTLRVGLP
jgi:hypothetical protein